MAAFARSITSVGSPVSFPRRTWNKKKSHRIDRFTGFVVGARLPCPPLEPEELLQPFSADGRLQVVELQVGEVAGELVEARLMLVDYRAGGFI